MNHTEIKVAHNGTEFHYEVETWAECPNCGLREELEDQNLELKRCVDCHQESVPEIIGRYHFYIKQAWWIADSPSGVQEYADLLRQSASRLEALEADGWELVDSDMEHLYFEKSPLDI